MTDTVSYADRFQWLKLVMSQPKSVLTADTKNVLTTLFIAFDNDKDHKTIHYKTIAEATGLSEEGVRGCFKRAKRAGFIHSVGKGGFIRKEGEVTGLASTFWMTMPPGSANTGEAPARVDEPLYPVWPAPLPGLASPSTRFGQTANSSFSSSFSPTLFSSDEEVIHQADFKMQLPWGDLWPKETTRIEPPTPGANEKWVQGRIVDLALRVLGFVPGVARTASESATWADLSNRLNALDVSSLSSRYRAGLLTNVDVATALATAGIIPPMMEPGVEVAKAS